MKKVALLSVVFILIAVSVVPVMAAKPDNGHGNGGNGGQGNSAGDQSRQQDKNQTRMRDREKNTNRGFGRKGNLGSARMRTPFYLQGTITGVFSDTITVEVIHSNATVKKFFSNTFTDTVTNTLTVNLSDTTQIFKITQADENEGSDETPSRAPILASDLAIGQRVAIHGNFVNGMFNATLITVYIKTALGEPLVGNSQTP